jgi:hypothetical protein
MNYSDSKLLDLCIAINDFEAYFKYKNFTRNEVKYKMYPLRIKRRSASFS